MLTPANIADVQRAQSMMTQAQPSISGNESGGNESSFGTEKNRLAAMLSAFNPILLDEMNSVALLDRFEVKYVMHLNSLVPILNRLGETYSVLTIADQRLSRYRTLYFDTNDFVLYLRHHMGARNRYKVRAREYVESHATFLEVKHKTNKQRTTKHRIPTSELLTTLHSSEQFLIALCPYTADDLRPCLWNSYTRITLVNQARRERVTLDIDLGFSWKEQRVSLPGVVIAEVKQPSRSSASDFTTLLREQHIRRMGFSKYCVGVSLLNPQMKHNNFKAIHRFIAKLAHKEEHREEHGEEYREEHREEYRGQHDHC